MNFIFYQQKSLSKTVNAICLQHLGSQDDVAARIDVDMKMKMDANNRFMAANKERVIQQIMKYVYDIKPAIHQNYRLDWTYFHLHFLVVL